MAEKRRFAGQQEDETIIIFERRHWYILIQWLKIPLLLLLASSLIVWGMVYLGRSWMWLLMLAPALLWMTWRILNWENDYYIVTNKRVIHIEQVYFLREKRDEAPLAMIQDVNVDMVGITPNLLYFGNVFIQTAGTLGTIRFKGIREPRNVQAQILGLMSWAKAARPSEEESQAVQVVREIVGLPEQEPGPAPPTAERLRREGEELRRAQLSEMIKSMFFPKPVFGENQTIWRKHWWILLREMISPLLTVVILFVLWLAGSLVLGFGRWFDVLFGIALATTFVWLIWRAIDWRNDLYIITDDRVIDIEKVPFIREHRREARLDKIQDVRYLREGFIAIRLDFGNVRLETAGEIGEFTFDDVPHPRQVQEQIFKRLGDFRGRAQKEAERQRREEVAAMVEKYLRQRPSGAPRG